MNKLYNDDAFKVLDEMIEDNVKVDMVLIDPPYNTVKGLDYNNYSHRSLTNANLDWDVAVDFKALKEKLEKIMKPHTQIIVTCDLMMNNFLNIFNEDLSHYMVWEKESHSNPLTANVMPLKRTELITVYRKQYGLGINQEQRDYFEKVHKFIGKKKTEIVKETNQGLDHCFRYTSKQFKKPKEENYNILIEKYNIDKMDGFKTYEELYERPFTFNRSELTKNNVLHFNKDNTGIHPTQKPIKLIEHLIKTYSNENDLILDCFMGSGTTGVACKNLNRNFIGVELDKDYFEIAKKRIEDI